MPSSSISSAPVPRASTPRNACPVGNARRCGTSPGFWCPPGCLPRSVSDDDEEDAFDAEIPEKLGLAEETVQHGKRAKRGFFPSSMGLSFLVQPDAGAVRVTVAWGDYRRAKGRDWTGKEIEAWAREPRAETVEVELGNGSPYTTRSVPGSGGLVLHTVERPIPTEGLRGQISPGTRAVSVFLVNERPVAQNSKAADQTYAFQAQLSVECDRPFHPRPDLSRQRTADWDDQVARLHYADTPAFATGHGGVGGLDDPERRMQAGAHGLDRDFAGRSNRASA